MANNDKLKPIITNLQNLTDLVVRMKDAELYPVSFFSNAFDLIQKVQNDFHTLEADQVELFASQMKKHQDLITSIHQQVRNIENIPQVRKSDNVSGPPAIAPEQPRQQPITDYIIPQNTDNNTIKSDHTYIEKPKKTSIFSRIIGKENLPREAEVKEMPEIIEKEVAQSIKIKESSPPTISTPIVIPQPKPMENVVPEEKSPHIPPEITAGIRKEITAINQPVTIPVEKPKIVHPVSSEEKVHKQEALTTLHLSVNDIIGKNKLSDLRKAFNLNDRFRYQRELFGGNEDVMNKVIAELNSKTSYKESIEYLEDKLHWDISDLTVKDFMKKLEIRFL